MTGAPAVLVDTDVASFSFKKDSRATLFRPHLAGKALLLSFMNLAELHAWATQRGWGQARRDELTRHLTRYTVHYPDAVTCELWATVDHEARRTGRPIACADAWVAATARRLNLPIVTNNPADFAGVKGLTLLGPVKATGRGGRAL